MNSNQGPRWLHGIPLALAVVLGAAGVWTTTTVGRAQHDANDLNLSSLPAGNTRASAARARADDLSQAFRDAARSVLPAVVVIKSPDETACSHCGRPHSQEDSDDEMQGHNGHSQPDDSLAVLGSGFIVDGTGLVMTNQHVVASAGKLVVQLSDGRQFQAICVREDAKADLAILKIEAKGSLPVARFADADRTEIGDWVLAIGCPLELEQTVSAGIISAKNRSFCSRHQTRMLQTDAAVNPGSSGGPLVNLSGEVVGVTSSIASDDGGYQGIGFAIPASRAITLLTQTAGTMKKR